MMLTKQNPKKKGAFRVGTGLTINWKTRTLQRVPVDVIDAIVPPGTLQLHAYPFNLEISPATAKKLADALLACYKRAQADRRRRASGGR